MPPRRATTSAPRCPCGDLNGDNRPELVVGVPGEDVGTVKDAGGYVTMNGTEHGPYGGLARSQSTPNMPGTAEAA